MTCYNLLIADFPLYFLLSIKRYNIVQADDEIERNDGVKPRLTLRCFKKILSNRQALYTERRHTTVHLGKNYSKIQ